MTAPSAQAIQGTSSGSQVTSLTVDLPDGIATGERLVVMVAIRKSGGSAPVFTWPTGWTVLATDDDSEDRAAEVAEREVDGTEGFTGTGDSISVSWTNSTDYAQSWAVLIDASDDAEATFAAGTSGDPDPPNESHSGGSGDYLAIAFECHDGASTTDSAPTNYSNFNTDNSGGGGSAVTASVATRELTSVSSENPGTFDQAVSKDWYAFTVLVPEAAGGGPPVSASVTMSEPGDLWIDTPEEIANFEQTVQYYFTRGIDVFFDGLPITVEIGTGVSAAITMTEPGDMQVDGFPPAVVGVSPQSASIALGIGDLLLDGLVITTEGITTPSALIVLGIGDIQIDGRAISILAVSLPETEQSLSAAYRRSRVRRTRGWKRPPSYR